MSKETAETPATSTIVKPIGSGTQTSDDPRKPTEKDFCVQVEMIPRPTMVDAHAQTDPEQSPTCYGMKGSKIDTEHDHKYPKGQRVKKKIIKRDSKCP